MAYHTPLPTGRLWHRACMVISQTLNTFANPTGRRRRLFIPPSTNQPLFTYGDDNRLFLSLAESGSAIESDAASIASSRLLPSTLSLVNAEDQASFHSWLLEERQRRYLAVSSAKLIAEFAKPTLLPTEVRMTLRYAVPLIITFVLEHVFSIVCLLVVGHLGTTELAAVLLGLMTATITFAVFEGIATALDTLCPQAFGAGQYELVLVHVQRCTLFSLLVFVPCGVFWYHSDWVLGLVIADREVVRLTTQFLRILIPIGPPYVFFECFKRFLQAQGIFEAGTGVLFVCAPINALLLWLLVWHPSGFGYAGAPLAMVLNYFLMCVMLVLYTVYIDGLRCWFGFASAKTLLQQWGSLAHLAVPGIVMLESEYLAYEIMTLLASYIGTAELAAQSAVGAVALLTYMVPFSVGIAASTRIASYVGAQNKPAAQIATKSGLVVGLAVSTLNCIVLLVGSRHIARLFTKDEQVIRLALDLMCPLVAVLQVFDGVASVALGILRAQGLQKIGSVINLLAYYVFAMPLAVFFSKYLQQKLEGLWYGIGSGMVLIAVAETAVVMFSDWDEILTKAGLLMDADLD